MIAGMDSILIRKNFDRINRIVRIEGPLAGKEAQVRRSAVL
jgi:hypothetical protein